MKAIYVDSSVIVSILFREPHSKKLLEIINQTSSTCYSSQILEAEVYASATRENIVLAEAHKLLMHINLLLPERSLRKEYKEIFSAGYCRGADAYHIACALYLDPERTNLIFLTADQRQQEVAKKVKLTTVSG